ncbi:hypothetical protein [Sedimentitalea todarodis]|uniref:Uncharacterized protein n=1 Tax=Sedimentitalea todarodis TaxID=1631240 RepID=A0ABU3VFV7_9RHOB|nr:hypothetical protein [Sedimentitalea todarodis]MDU9005064.1 hypothetical protein [Sedimentitalea todarodis]
MFRMIARFFALVLAVPAMAQTPEWQFQSSDDGSFFTGSIITSDDRDMMFLCGERSPQGLTALQTGNMEPDITPRDSLRLYMSDKLIGRHDGVTQERQDVLLVAGATGYRLPVVIWNELFSTWEVDLPATDPAFSMIAEQADFEVRSNAGSRVITSIGLRRAHATLTAHCQSMFTAIGQPWHTVAPAAAPQVSMRQIAEAAIQSGCGGPATKGPKTFLSGEIDGDGTEDVVVFWGEITCSGGYPRPYCGASMCSAQIFASARHARGERPEDLLAQAVWLQPLSNGNMGVVTVGSLATCQNRPNCEFIWYWNGREIVQLN